MGQQEQTPFPIIVCLKFRRHFMTASLVSGVGLQLEAPLAAPARLEGGNNLLHVGVLLEHRAVAGEQLPCPLLGLEGQRGALAGLDVAVVVEDGQLVGRGQPLVAQQELLDVAAPLEQLPRVPEPEGVGRLLLPGLALDSADGSEGDGVDGHRVLDLDSPVGPVLLGLGQRGHRHVVVEGDVREQLAVFHQAQHEVQVVGPHVLSLLEQSPLDLLHLGGLRLAVDGHEDGTDLVLEEARLEVLGLHEEAPLVQAPGQRPQGLALGHRAPLPLVEQLEEGEGALVVTSEALVQRVAQQSVDPQQMRHVEEVEAEGVLLGRLVEVAAGEAVPKGDVAADLRGHELREAAHTGHRVGAPQSVQQVLIEVCLDGLEVLDVSLADEGPDGGHPHVEVAHDLAARDQLGDGVVAHRHVRAVGAEGNGAQQPVLGEGVLEELVAVLGAREGRQSCLELAPEGRVVEDAEGTGVDVVDEALLEAQQQRLTLVDQDLRYVLVHDDRALDQVLAELAQFDALIELALFGDGGSGHLVGLDLAETVLAAHIAAQTDQVVEALLQTAVGHLLEVPLLHSSGQLDRSSEVVAFKFGADEFAVALLAELLGELLDEARLGADQLVLELRVALPSHIHSYHQLLYLLVLFLKAVETDLLQLVQHLVVAGSEAYLLPHRVGSTLAEHFALRVSREGTRY